MRDRRNLKKLKSVITAPVITCDDRIVAELGYDAETQLYVDGKKALPSVPEQVDLGLVERALAILMEPFQEFPYATVLDKSVLLCAALTAIQRQILPTAPAIGIDAPAQGTGKTYLAKCLGILATGKESQIFPHSSGSDEEIRKRLLAALTSGQHVLLWDNILGYFDSPAMASFLTSEIFTDRILGRSEVLSVPSNVLVLLTGNNLSLLGDMPRRVLKCRLDAKVANPALRKFELEPAKYIAKNRHTLVEAGLMLIRGYLQSDAFRTGGAVPNESTASFDDWDSLCRQTVAWIAQNFSGWEDPANALKEAVASDPEILMLAILLDYIEQVMGDGWWETRALIEKTRLIYEDFISREQQLARSGLSDSLRDLVMNKELTARGVGRALGYRVDRIADDRRLVSRKKSSRTFFRVEKVEI